MNRQRRFLIKALVASGLGLSSYAGYRWLNQPEKMDLRALLGNVYTNEALASVTEQFEAPYTQLEAQLDVSADIRLEALKDALTRAIRADFSMGRVLIIDQWHLSQTEALLLASAIEAFGFKQDDAIEKNFANARQEDFVVIENWGPRETYQGVKFNEQPDGHCGIWIVAQDLPDGVEVYLNGVKNPSFSSEKGITTGIYREVDAFLQRVGTTEIVLYDAINHRKQTVGTFEVLPPFTHHRYADGTTSKVFGELTGWGPDRVRVGEVFNQQPNGHAALWFKVNSTESQINIEFNNERFKATVRKDLITVSFHPDYLPVEPGRYPVWIISEAHNERLLAGEIEVVPDDASE
jgi:hypothetical protein